MTVADLITQLRASYDGSMSEAAFLDGLCDVDLLVIDEVGVLRVAAPGRDTDEPESCVADAAAG
ncbi:MULTISPECIES: hypothetical protein [Pantoea]|uniref:hypothetical protein n=1 Tax=Pantoea TaxID=53335 RepID=UPI001E41DFE2|nr:MULTISPECIES: hypothetical protein [Pantoea]